MSGHDCFIIEHTGCPFQGKTQHPEACSGSRTQTDQDGAERVKGREAQINVSELKRQTRDGRSVFRIAR